MAFLLLLFNSSVLFVLAKSWTEDEVKAIKKHLNKFFLTGKVPRKNDIEVALEEQALTSRSWRDIKNYIHNFHRSQKKKLSKT